MKRTLILFAFFLSGWFLTACESDTCGCTNISLGVGVRLRNADGADILNPVTPGSISEQDIDVFYKIDGKLKTHASLNKGAQLDNPEGFSVAWDGAGYLLNVLTNPTVGNNVVTLIRIEGEPDIKLVTKVTGTGGKILTKLWYDDQLIWKSGDQTYPEVTITLD